MTFNQKRVLRACAQILDRIEANPAYDRTSGLLVEVGGQVRFAVDRRGPAVADVFSVTKSVTATLVGIALADGHIKGLDSPAAPSPHTWRQLLTMTRGCQTDGEWDLDAVMALPGGWIPKWLDAPQITDPGKKFRYDDGAYHLLAAALVEATGRRLVEYADERLFSPLGIDGWAWPTDSEGLHLGFGHLHLDRPALATLGRLWLDQGEANGTALLPPEYARAMVTAHTPGGAPEVEGLRVRALGGEGQVRLLRQRLGRPARAGAARGGRRRRHHGRRRLRPGPAADRRDARGLAARPSSSYARS